MNLGLELRRLESRYASRKNRNTWVSDAKYVDGDYVYTYRQDMTPANSNMAHSMPSLSTTRTASQETKPRAQPGFGSPSHSSSRGAGVGVRHDSGFSTRANSQDRSMLPFSGGEQHVKFDRSNAGPSRRMGEFVATGTV